MAGAAINDSQKIFLEKVMQKANFPDINDEIGRASCKERV